MWKSNTRIAEALADADRLDRCWSAHRQEAGHQARHDAAAPHRPHAAVRVLQWTMAEPKDSMRLLDSARARVCRKCADRSLTAAKNLSFHCGRLIHAYGPGFRPRPVRITTCIVEAYGSEAFDVLMPASDGAPRGLAKASAVNDTGVILIGGVHLDYPRGRSEALWAIPCTRIRRDANQCYSSCVARRYSAFTQLVMKNLPVRVPDVEEQRAICSVSQRHRDLRSTHCVSDSPREST